MLEHLLAVDPSAASSAPATPAPPQPQPPRQMQATMSTDAGKPVAGSSAAAAAVASGSATQALLAHAPMQQTQPLRQPWPVAPAQHPVQPQAALQQPGPAVNTGVLDFAVASAAAAVAATAPPPHRPSLSNAVARTAAAHLQLASGPLVGAAAAHELLEGRNCNTCSGLELLTGPPPPPGVESAAGASCVAATAALTAAVAERRGAPDAAPVVPLSSSAAVSSGTALCSVITDGSAAAANAEVVALLARGSSVVQGAAAYAHSCLGVSASLAALATTHGDAVATHVCSPVLLAGQATAERGSSATNAAAGLCGHTASAAAATSAVSAAGASLISCGSQLWDVGSSATAVVAATSLSTATARLVAATGRMKRSSSSNTSVYGGGGGGGGAGSVFQSGINTPVGATFACLQQHPGALLPHVRPAAACDHVPQLLLGEGTAAGGRISCDVSAGSSIAAPTRAVGCASCHSVEVGAGAGRGVTTPEVAGLLQPVKAVRPASSNAVAAYLEAGLDLTPRAVHALTQRHGFTIDGVLLGTIDAIEEDGELSSRDYSVTICTATEPLDVPSAVGGGSSKALSTVPDLATGGGRQQPRWGSAATPVGTGGAPARSGGAVARALRSGFRRTTAQLLGGLFASNDSAACSAGETHAELVSCKRGVPRDQTRAVALATAPLAQVYSRAAAAPQVPPMSAEAERPYTSERTANTSRHSAPLWPLLSQPSNPGTPPAAGPLLARTSAATAAAAAVPAQNNGAVRRRAESLHMPRCPAPTALAAPPLCMPPMVAVTIPLASRRAAAAAAAAGRAASSCLDISMTAAGNGSALSAGGAGTGGGMRKISSQPDLHMLSSFAGAPEWAAGGQQQQHRLMLSTGVLQPLDELAALGGDTRWDGSNMLAGGASHSIGGGVAAALFMTTADGGGLFCSPAVAGAGAFSSSACGVPGIAVTAGSSHCGMTSAAQQLGTGSASQPLRLQSVQLLQHSNAEQQAAYQQQLSWGREASAQVRPSSSGLMRCEAVDEEAAPERAHDCIDGQQPGHWGAHVAAMSWKRASAPPLLKVAACAATAAGAVTSGAPPLLRAATMTRSGCDGTSRQPLGRLWSSASTATRNEVYRCEVFLPAGYDEASAGSTGMGSAAQIRDSAFNPTSHKQGPMQKLIKAVRKVVGKSPARDSKM